MTTVLFLGLGHMGGPMAANLAAAGHRVLGFDLVPEALEKARAAGVETVTTNTPSSRSTRSTWTPSRPSSRSQREHGQAAERASAHLELS